VPCGNVGAHLAPLLNTTLFGLLGALLHLLELLGHLRINGASMELSRNPKGTQVAIKSQSKAAIKRAILRVPKSTQGHPK
jgi:hypothetical protein